MLRYLDADSAAELDQYPVPQIVFNYLGRFPVSDDADWQPATESAALATYGNSALPLDHPIALNAITHDTAAGPVLSANWSFAPALLSETEVNRLADRWSAALEALVLHAAQPGVGGLSPGDLELVSLDQAEIESFEQQYPDLKDVWPLTPLQEGLLFHAHYDSEGEDPYLVQLVFELDGAIDSARLRSALDALLDRHASLRVAFHRIVRDSRFRSCSAAARCRGSITISAPSNPANASGAPMPSRPTTVAPALCSVRLR